MPLLRCFDVPLAGFPVVVWNAESKIVHGADVKLRNGVAGFRQRQKERKRLLVILLLESSESVLERTGSGWKRHYNGDDQIQSLHSCSTHRWARRAIWHPLSRRDGAL